jgi:hypothetical protein
MRFVPSWITFHYRYLCRVAETLAANKGTLADSTLVPGGDGDFNPRLRYGELGYSEGCAGWALVLEVRKVDGVHSLEEFHVREIDLDCNNVGIVHLGFAKNDADVVQNLPNFSFEVRRHFLGFEIASDLAGHVQGAIDENGRTEWRAGGELLGLDDLSLGA